MLRFLFRIPGEALFWLLCLLCIIAICAMIHYGDNRQPPHRDSPLSAIDIPTTSTLESLNSTLDSSVAAAMISDAMRRAAELDRARDLARIGQPHPLAPYWQPPKPEAPR